MAIPGEANHREPDEGMIVRTIARTGHFVPCGEGGAMSRNDPLSNIAA